MAVHSVIHITYMIYMKEYHHNASVGLHMLYVCWSLLDKNEHVKLLCIYTENLRGINMQFMCAVHCLQ